MSTLYVRDVPDEVTEMLKQRAAVAGMSLSAYVAAELSRIARRPTNAEVLARLEAQDRSHGPTTQEIVDVVRDSRQ